MSAVARLVGQIRPYFKGPDADLLKIVLNASSWIEANLAVELLKETVPEKSLATAANIREAIRDLPRCPILMALDLETLAKVWDLQREDMGWKRSFKDSSGRYDVVLLGDGNLCYDIVVRKRKHAHMWMPRATQDDLINPEVVDLIMKHDTLLKNVVDLVETMGLPFSPLYYLSLQDWREEYALTVFGEVERTFGLPDPDAAEETPRKWFQIKSGDLKGSEVRFRGMAEDGWLF